MTPIILSKSLFLSGLQCLKRLYLEVYHPELIPPPDSTREALFDQGHQVGLLATRLYPGGRMVEWGEARYTGVVRETELLLKDPDVPAIFEATFEVNDLRIKTDILARNTDGTWELLEVKSGKSVKDVYMWDLAFQQYVLFMAGLKTNRFCIIQLNPEYVHPGGDLILEELFYKANLTDKLPELISYLPSKIDDLQSALAGNMAPEVDIGQQCCDPYDCPFWDYCTAHKPKHWIQYFYKMSQAKKAELKGSGIHDIRDIPDGVPLSPIQRRIRDVLISGKPYFDPQLKTILSGLIEPIHYLDFETFNPAIPRYAGTSPYDIIPFLWSLHVEEGGKVQHHAFLVKGNEDPRPEFVSTLLDAIAPTGHILIYSNYETIRLKSLIPLVPERAADIEALIARCVDFCDIIRKNVYHPNFDQSFSLKAVISALIPELAYNDLEIKDGMTASRYFITMLEENDSAKRRSLRNALLNYCKRDTLAMAALKEHFWGLVGPEIRDRCKCSLIR